MDATQAACAAAVCTPVEEDALFLAVDGQSALTDAVDGDVGRFDSGSSTIEAGTAGGNASVVVPANRVWVVQFTARMP